MREVADLKLKKDKKRLSAQSIFLFALVILMYSPFAGISSMYGMVGDTAIQIRLGLDDLASGHLITDEIYSWHENLVFTAHECGWYLLLGIMYKLLNIWGVIAVGTVFTYATGITTVRYSADRINPFIIAFVIIATPFLNGYPDYNVRPAVTSIFASALLMVTLIGDRKSLFKAVLFASLCFVLGWMHGGTLPLFFVVYGVFVVMELLYKEFRGALIMIAGAAAGFILSLLNPIGIRCYTFGLKQSGATDIWAYVDEWGPMRFNFLQLILIALVFIGFATGDGIRKFDKKTLTKLGLLTMFLIMTCVYKRFVAYFSVAYLLFAPEQYKALVSWLCNNVIKPKKELKLQLSDSFYKILAAVCGVMLIGLGAFYIPTYLPTGTMADIEKMAAYDPAAVEFIKDRGYGKIFNSFDTGSWLAFHGVRVHIDNRIDPFMSEFSGEDHIRGQMSVGSLSDLDNFRDRYDNDAFLVNISVDDNYLVDEINTYAEDRYRIVYDNTVDSSVPGVSSIRWLIIECI